MSNYVTKNELDEFGLKLFKYFDKRFDSVHEEIAEVRGDVRQLHYAIDAYAKEVETYQQESVARDSEVNRLSRWIEQVAHKTGVKLEY